MIVTLPPGLSSTLPVVMAPVVIAPPVIVKESNAVVPTACSVTLPLPAAMIIDSVEAVVAAMSVLAANVTSPLSADVSSVTLAASVTSPSPSTMMLCAVTLPLSVIAAVPAFTLKSPSRVVEPMVFKVTAPSVVPSVWINKLFWPASVP